MKYFNSRPHGGRLIDHNGAYVQDHKFQLTPSRRATTDSQKELSEKYISTHALTEGDLAFSPQMQSPSTFQLTPSRRATESLRQMRSRERISTHALTEGDQVMA